MSELPAIPIPGEVLDAIAERVADIVIERLGAELRPATGRWMRTREAAEYLGLTRSALYSRIGDVPHHKVDRLLLFKRDDLDEWLAKHRCEVGRAERVRSTFAAAKDDDARGAATTSRVESGFSEAETGR